MLEDLHQVGPVDAKELECCLNVVKAAIDESEVAGKDFNCRFKSWFSVQASTQSDGEVGNEVCEEIKQECWVTHLSTCLFEDSEEDLT